jgi:hypothetical protein
MSKIQYKFLLDIIKLNLMVHIPKLKYLLHLNHSKLQIQRYIILIH